MSGGYFTQQVPLSPRSREVDRLCVWDVISLWEYSHNESKIYIIAACDCLLFQRGVKSEFRGMYLGAYSINILRLPVRLLRGRETTGGLEVSLWKLLRTQMKKWMMKTD